MDTSGHQTPDFEVANWHSVPSEPVATFVDPPIGWWPKMTSLVERDGGPLVGQKIGKLDFDPRSWLQNRGWVSNAESP